jgi:hypothetical protein
MQACLFVISERRSGWPGLVGTVPATTMRIEGNI